MKTGALFAVLAIVLFSAVACASLRGGEQGGYWQQVTREVK